MEDNIKIKVVDLKEKVIIEELPKPPLNTYEIDFDKINSVEDIKKIFSAMSVRFVEHTPGFFEPYLDIFKLKPTDDEK